MFEDLATKKAFQKLKDECYYPIIQMLERFAIDFMTHLFYNCNLNDLKMQGGTKIPERLMKAVDHFKRFEMITNEKGELVLCDKFIDGLKPPANFEPMTRQELRTLLSQKTAQVETLQQELDHLNTDVVNKLRMGYQQELQALKDQLYWKEKLQQQQQMEENTSSSASSQAGSSRKNPFREIDVRYYDIGAGLPQQYTQIINLKIKDMKD